MFKSLIIAFSTYSRIPMPDIKWDDKGMKYSMCFFPLVGAVCGAIGYFLLYVMGYFNVTPMLSAAVLTVLPILVTGGIHMDGFMDTVDAKSSYKDKEEKLRILKDPHTGAFAVIYCVVYNLLMLGLMYEIVTYDKALSLYVYVAITYTLSRILSGLSVVYFKKAKKDGMLSETSKSQSKSVGPVLIALLIILAVGSILLEIISGCLSIVFAIAVFLAGALSFIYYRYMSYKVFGGTTGDLAGYFLCVCELLGVFAVVICSYCL